MHPLSLLIVVLLIVLILYFAVYIWRQQNIEARQFDERMKIIFDELERLEKEKEDKQIDDKK